MSQNIAVIDVTGKVLAINVHIDEYVLTLNEVIVKGSAWVGGDYVDGHFYPPQPFPSWTRHEGEWRPPTFYPTDGDMYSWDEVTGEWVAV